METKKLFYRLMTLVLLNLGYTNASAQAQWAFETELITGSNTSGIAITPDNSKIVITNNSNPGSVKVISTLDYSIVSIDVSSIENYPNGIAITPDGTKALVNTLHKTIYIDLSNNTICGSFTAPCAATSLTGIAITGNTAVFPDLSASCVQQGLRTMNTGCSNSSSNFILDNNGGQLYGIAVTNDGAAAIVTGFSTHGPTNVNLTTSAVQDVTGMSQSYGVATFHLTNEALVFDGTSIVRVSLSSNTVTNVITDLTYNAVFQNIAITSDDKYAFVIGAFDKKIIDLSNNTVIQTFASGQTNVATTSNGSKFFVTDSYNGTLRVYRNISGLGIDDFENDKLNVTVYPNPTTGKITISSLGNISKIEIYNVLGKKIFQNKTPQLSNTTIDLSAHPKGIYFVKIVDGDKSYTKKIVLK